MEQSGQFDPSSLLIEFKGNLCLSGGAKGADAQWGMTAGKAGHSVIHWSYEGHKAYVPEQELVRLTQDQLNIADPALHRANESIGRVVPTWKPWLCNLLRRNYYQVKWAQSVYAVSKFDNKGKVDGGTAWACQMYLDRFLKDGEPIDKCKLYLYDQDNSCWLMWTQTGWLQITEPPAPEGIWAGIGSRDLFENGKNAIRKLMGYAPVAV
jgi:hypothetical protein